MSDQVIVTWGIHDGYAGSRPQETIIDKDEFDGMDEVTKRALIEDYVQQDLEQMGFYISDIDWGD